MEFKTVWSKNGKPRHLILYNDEWMSFHALAETVKARDNNLSPQILQWRYRTGHRSEAGLFATKNKRSGKKVDTGHAQEGGLFNKCDRKLADVCILGTNHDLLKVEVSREPYITPGEKRRLGLM